MCIIDRAPSRNLQHMRGGKLSSGGGGKFGELLLLPRQRAARLLWLEGFVRTGSKVNDAPTGAPSDAPTGAQRNAAATDGVSYFGNVGALAGVDSAAAAFLLDWKFAHRGRA